jgi:hypothetical protein
MSIVYGLIWGGPGYNRPFQIPLQEDTNFLILLGLFGIRQRSFESVNLLDQIRRWCYVP